MVQSPCRNRFGGHQEAYLFVEAEPGEKTGKKVVTAFLVEVEQKLRAEY